ncbi:MAG: lipopolysaccharide kinase InaA family protein [Rhodocyclaceae bacterium]|nr:lipopolysaccharide kinase InaA family protein [Rhodocyclaceae bacterium]
MSLPLETAASLCEAGRSPTAPSRIELDDGKTLQLQRLLRVLPGKRITAIGELAGLAVVMKLFISPRDSARHWQRECRGIGMLTERNLPTPRLLAAGRLQSHGHYVLTEFIDESRDLLPLPETLDDLHLAQLESVFRTLGLMHAQGLVHDDAHLGNFLLKDGAIYIIDGDAVRVSRSVADLLDNLALLLAQLPPSGEATCRETLLAAYRSGNPDLPLDLSPLDSAIARTRQHRLKDYLKKCLRDCSLFKVEQQRNRFVAMVRNEADFLAPILADPDRWLDAGTPLKQGRTATLAMIEHGGRKLVIKRYNIKGPGHALSRCWRPSRAWHSWVAGHRLEFLGIATPRPLAMIESRYGPLQRLRGTAWLIVEHCNGDSLAARFSSSSTAEPPNQEISAIGTLFHQLAAALITHGDLKATNLLWCEARLSLIDLDAMRQHRDGAAFMRSWRKDRKRLLRNWPEDSALRRSLDAVLPPG